MGEKEVEAFLTHLAVNRRLAESTQNQALGAILFLYRHVLEQPLGLLDAVRASKPKRLPTVLSKDEVRRLIAALPENASHRLIVELLYGTGMRISECCQTSLSFMLCSRLRQELDPDQSGTLTVEQVRRSLNAWLAHHDLPPPQRDAAFKKELADQDYYHHRNLQAQKSHTRTRRELYEEMGIDVDKIKTCIT